MKDIGEIKQNRKIDISLLFSICALIIATLQFIVSTPFFSNYYYRADYEVKELSPYLIDKTLITRYTIVNNSQNTVNAIEIGIQVLSKDIVQISPDNNINITCKDNGPDLKDCYIHIDKLVPEEEMDIIIQSNYDTLAYYLSSSSKDKIVPNELMDDDSIYSLRAPSDYNVPTIMFAKYDKGFAKIILCPKSNLFNKQNR